MKLKEKHCFVVTYSKAPFIVSTVGIVKSKVPFFGGNHFLYKLRRFELFYSKQNLLDYLHKLLYQ